MTADVTVSREIAAPAEQVWTMVADLTRMGEWSPENQGGTWLKGADGPAPGVKFRGVNRNGTKTWKAVATIVDAEPGRRFAFRTSAMGIPVAEWTYEIEPTGAGCRVTESFTDRRPGWFKPLARLATGVDDRVSHNRAGMEQTLERLGVAAEAASAS